ncbi:tail fiber protein [Ruegeria sp. 2205SS24-7]|uniref:phage tail protein n=1 Tax=Ruegeria discodermiae TaxID=3064389 RepID=UPI002740C705|nr:tail fiber protein [Ruegeria sp. 2205SS24-7]MDP5216697.1 tail fiber protein [Ruegeria sp. 2205SS24-7]
MTFNSVEPDGWYFLNGQALSKTGVPTLYEVFGGTYGETETTFNLPDLRDRLPVGAGTTALMALAGSSTATLNVGNLPAHNHGVTDAGHSHTFTGTPHNHTITDPGHSHIDMTRTATVDVTAGADGRVPLQNDTVRTSTDTTGITIDNATADGTVGSGTTGITIDNTGSGDAFDILPPVIGVNWLVKS